MRRPCTKNSRESTLFKRDLALWRDGMLFCGKSWSSSSEALRLRSSVRWAEGASAEVQSALFGRQAAWRPGAFVDKLCQRRSVHARCWGISHGRAGGSAGSACTRLRHAQQIRCRWQGVCGSCCWSIQMFPRGQCSPVRRAFMGRFGLTMGRSCCGTSGSPCEWSTGSWVTWCTFRAVMAEALAPGILCDEETQRRTAGEIVFQRLDPIKVKGRGPPQWQFSSRSSGLLRCPIGVTLELNSCPPWCDIILVGSVIAARGVPGAMKGVEDIRGEVGRGAGGRFMLTAC